MQVKRDTLLAYVSSLSGLFITKTSPHGLTPTELILICYIHSISQGAEITREMKAQIANDTNHGLQVITNAINKLTKKGVIVDNKLHPIFLSKQITIEYGKGAM
jgi:hypothetical protein